MAEATRAKYVWIEMLALKDLLRWAEDGELVPPEGTQRKGPGTPGATPPTEPVVSKSAQAPEAVVGPFARSAGGSAGARPCQAGPLPPPLAIPAGG